jgi:hypothetical protein
VSEASGRIRAGVRKRILNASKPVQPWKYLPTSCYFRYVW